MITIKDCTFDKVEKEYKPKFGEESLELIALSMLADDERNLLLAWIELGSISQLKANIKIVGRLSIRDKLNEIKEKYKNILSKLKKEEYI